MAKSAIMTTANTEVSDNDRVSPAGPFAMGAGMVDPGMVAKPGSAFNPGLVYDAGIVDYLGFLCDAGPEIFADPDATCQPCRRRDPDDGPRSELPVDRRRRLAGTQTVHPHGHQRCAQPTVTSATVNAPPATPSSSTPDHHAGAGRDGVVRRDDHQRRRSDRRVRFGDLTWSGDGYAVRSPIAVQGVPLDAPAEVTGTGTSGSTTFDVKFGYTGAYTAAPHGLVAPTERR